MARKKWKLVCRICSVFFESTRKKDTRCRKHQKGEGDDGKRSGSSRA